MTRPQERHRHRDHGCHVERGFEPHEGLHVAGREGEGHAVIQRRKREDGDREAEDRKAHRADRPIELEEGGSPEDAHRDARGSRGEQHNRAAGTQREVVLNVKREGEEDDLTDERLHGEDRERSAAVSEREKTESVRACRLRRHAF